jgi:ankyrin repeat protein
VRSILKMNSTICVERKLELFDLNAVGGVHEWTALHLAAHGGHLDIVRELVEAGADIF